MKKIFIYVVFSLFYSGCQMYDDYSPKSGIFCNLQSQSPDCIELNLEKHTGIYENQEFPLRFLNRTHFLALIQNQNHEILFTSEHRILWKDPAGKEVFFHRKKIKKK